MRRNQKFKLRLTVDGTVFDRTASAVLVANLGAVLNDLVAFGDIPIAGFFAAGELGPVAGRNFVHGFTASILLFRNGVGAKL